MPDRNLPTTSDIEQKVAIGILQEQVKTGQIETNRRLDRIEKKIDEQHYVSVTSFDAFREDADRKYVTQDQFKPVKWFFYTAGGAIIGAVATAIVVFAIRGGFR